MMQKYLAGEDLLQICGQGLMKRIDGHPEVYLVTEVDAALAEKDEEIAVLKARFTAPIVCMCGSTRFKQTWITENARLTGEGNIVLSVGLWGHHERKDPDEQTKEALDDLHRRKIDLCDWVWVLDVGGYIGESTKNEIEYAEKLGRLVRYLSVEYPYYQEASDPLLEQIAALKEELAADRRATKHTMEEMQALLEENATLEKTATEQMEQIATLTKALQAIRKDTSIHRFIVIIEDAFSQIKALRGGEES